MPGVGRGILPINVESPPVLNGIGHPTTVLILQTVPVVLNRG